MYTKNIYQKNVYNFKYLYKKMDEVITANVNNH